MAIRIRLYPQGAAAGLNGYGAVSASTFYNQKLQSQSQISNLRLQYERALWNEKLDKVRLEERLKNPYLGANSLGYGGLGLGALGLGGLGLGGLGGVPLAGVPLATPMTTGFPIGGIPAGFPGGGQSNVTNQTSTGGASQTVTNSNVNNVSSVHRPVVGGYPGYHHPGFGFGSGGLISGLLGALI